MLADASAHLMALMLMAHPSCEQEREEAKKEFHARYDLKKEKKKDTSCKKKFLSQSTPRDSNAQHRSGPH